MGYQNVFNLGSDGRAQQIVGGSRVNGRCALLMKFSKSNIFARHPRNDWQGLISVEL
jgi:hypothetical protein